MEKRPSFAVVIPTKNRSEDLARCLSSLRKQSTPPDRIVVIDNGSTDATPSVLKQFEQVESVVDSTPCLPRLFNVGWRKTDCNIIAFLNDDTEADPDWVGAILEGFERYPDAAAVGTPTLDLGPRRVRELAKRNGILVRLYDRFLLRGKLYGWGVLEPWGAYSIGTDWPGSATRVGMLTVTNMAVRRATLERFQGFSEDFLFSNYDGFLFHQLQLADLPMYFVPRGVVKHYVNPSGSTRSAFYLSRDNAVFFGKLTPRKPMERVLAKATGLASLAFWWEAARAGNRNLFRSAVRGYMEGVAYLGSKQR